MKFNAFISYSHAADGKMASALQHALIRYAIPWYKRSKLNIFVDESDLSVTPHLWDNIEKSLSEAEYLIYMASVESRQSKWVNKELDYWINHKPINKLIIVVTDGEVVWDNKSKIFVQNEQSCIPELLNKEFNEEPFYVDLRSLKSNNELTLKNSIFNKEVLKIAAELYGISQKEMAGEELKTRRLVKRLSTIIISILSLLLVTTFYFYKVSKKNEKVAIEANEKVSDLLMIALQGRGDQYNVESVDSTIKILEYERTRPLKDLISPQAIREPVGSNDNFDYLIWIDVPSFRTDSIVEVKYKWPEIGYRYSRGNEMISKEPSTGYAFGYRGVNAIKDYIDITIYLKGNKTIPIQYAIRDSLNKKYGLTIPGEIIESK